MSETRLAARLRWLSASTAVLLLASIFRVANISGVPPGLSQDEVLNADIVTFIRQGKHALFFREGFGHEPLYHYWSVPFQLLLGDNLLSIRLPAIFLGLLLAAGVMRWARRDFGRTTAVIAGFLMAVSWWPIIFSRVGLRPIMEPLFLVGTAWFWQKKPALAGTFLGLSLYTYTGARVVFLIPLAYGIIQAVVSQSQTARRQIFKQTAVILSAAFLIYLPMQLTLWADPSLQQRVGQLAGPLKALQEGDWQPISQSILLTLGVFSFTGDPRWTYSWPGRPLFDGVTAVFFYAGIILALRRIRRPQYTLLLVWLAVTLIPSAITPQAPSIIRLIGAVPAVYVLVGVALAALIKRLSAVNGRALAVGYGLLLLVIALTSWRTVRDGFIAWPQAAETRLNHYQSTFWDMAQYWQQEPVENLVIADPFFEPIDAASFQRSLGREITARWVQAGGDAAGAMVFPQGAQMENGRLYVPEFASLNPILINALKLPTEPLYRSANIPSFAVYTITSAPNLPQDYPPVTFEEKITFLGYEILDETLDGTIPLMTYWRVEDSLPWNLKTFVHLTAADGSLLSQFDGLDAAPSQLQPGDIFVQYHPVPIPATLPENVQLHLGLYTPDDNQRLTHPGEPADRIVIVP